MKRTLTDSEARSEAVTFIVMSVEDHMAGGMVACRGEAEGWTEADMLAIERLISDRLDGMLRRSGAAERRGRRAARSGRNVDTDNDA